MSLRFAAVVVLAALSVVAVSAGQRETRERQILVSAALSNGSPATGLTPADFTVREDGVAREVIRVTAAPPPSHVQLIVDDSQAAQASVPFLRSGLAGLIKTIGAMTPAPQFALMTSGERPTKRADYSPNPAGVEQAVSKIFSIAGTGAYFLQAVRDACQDLRKRTASNPVIVAFVAEAGPEFSVDTRYQINDALKAAGASLWVVVLQPASSADRSPEEHERAVVLGDVTTDSGGMARIVLSPQSVEPAFTSIATLLTSRYLVTFGRPDQTIPPTAIDVTSKRADVHLTSTHWAR